MNGYLLDTNIVSYLYEPERSEHPLIDGILGSFDQSQPQLVSSITLGELRFGLQMTVATGRPSASFAKSIGNTESHPIVPVTPYTALQYGAVKSAIATRRVKFGKRLPRYPEDWVDRITDKNMDIDGNDLWIAAHAMETGATLVTCDVDFCRVIEDTGLALSCIHITLKTGDLRRFCGGAGTTDEPGADHASTLLGRAIDDERQSRLARMAGC